jgi:hypothetical protein
MKDLQKDQQRISNQVKEKMEQRSKLEKAKDQNMVEIKKVDSRIEKMTADL